MSAEETQRRVPMAGSTFPREREPSLAVEVHVPDEVRPVRRLPLTAADRRVRRVGRRVPGEGGGTGRVSGVRPLIATVPPEITERLILIRGHVLVPGDDLTDVPPRKAGLTLEVQALEAAPNHGAPSSLGRRPTRRHTAAGLTAAVGGGLLGEARPNVVTRVGRVQVEGPCGAVPGRP